jgi:hypothetical protein
LIAFSEFLGTDATTGEDQLDHAGKEAFGARFNGVFASNERFPLHGYSIVNTLPRNTAGEHWLAVCDGYLYDSFGRDKSGDTEQKYVETNCGQRCLAFINVYDQHGLGVAALI